MKDDKLGFLLKFINIGTYPKIVNWIWLIGFLSNVLVMFGQTVTILQSLGERDLGRLTILVTYYSMQWQCIYKCVITHWQRKRIIYMFDFAAEKFWDFETAPSIAKEKEKFCMLLINVVKGYAVFLVFLMTNVVFVPLLEFPPGMKKVPLYMNLPFDYNITPIYQFLYVWEALCVFMCITCIIVIDIIFMYFVQHLLIQFEILNVTLEQICSESKELTIEEEINNLYSPNFQYELQKKFVRCVNHHINLLEFGENLKAYCTSSLAMQLMFTFTMTIVMGFGAFESESMVFRVKCVVISVGVCMQFALAALQGGEVEAMSGSVSTAAYMSQWYLGNNKFKKQLLFFLMNAENNIKLSAAGLVYVNNNTLISIYQSAFSFITLLRNMNTTEN